uniref:Uncharacterized protein n=1 Tax=Gouania willdenowi TaxID=441366 RepID=A0A8C5HAU0_GOUWI
GRVRRERPGTDNASLEKQTEGTDNEKRVARYPWQWYLMERDRRVSGTGHYFDSKLCLIKLIGLD